MKRQKKSIALILLIILACIFTSCSPSYSRQYLFEKNVKWADGSSEFIQIDNHGNIYIDGLRKKLIGMHLSTHLPYGDLNQFYIPENIALLEKELTYLENAGFRLIRIEPPYIRYWENSADKEKKAWQSLMDMFYRHKMLVISCFIAKWFDGFEDLHIPDFSWQLVNKKANNHLIYTDSISQWARRFARTMVNYPNVIAVQVENELDYKLTEEDLGYGKKDQNYTVSGVSNYMKMLTDIFNSILYVPLTHNLIPSFKEVSIKYAALEYVDIPAFDCYAESPAELDLNLYYFFKWMRISDGWWCMEINYATVVIDNSGKAEWTLDSNRMNTDFINTVYNRGAALAILFWSNDRNNENWAFFDDRGEPKPVLQEIARLNIN